MATTKIASLAIRTLAKPIATQLKAQAKQHETFRNICIGLAQRVHRSEIGLRTRLLGEPAKHVRPLSEARAIENGAAVLSEGFLFLVAATIIIGESGRSAYKEHKRRENVRDELEELDERVDTLEQTVGQMKELLETEIHDAQRRNDELYRVLRTVVDVGLRGGWAEFKEHPLQLPPPSSFSGSHQSQSSPPTPEEDSASTQETK